MGARTDRPKSVGSLVSSRQIAYAAVNGQSVTFRFGANPADVVCGYVVGADDYHWFVLVTHSGPDLEPAPLFQCLLHKASVPLVIINSQPEAALSSAPQQIQDVVTEMGSGFWAYCQRTYFGKA